jgi:hypothetical protein
MGEQGVVAGVFLEVGIVPAEGPRHGVARPDDSPIDVDRQPRQVELFELLVEQLAIEGNQPLKRLLGELREPVDHGAVRGDPREPREARHQRIMGQIAQVLETAGADHEECEVPSLYILVGDVRPPPRAQFSCRRP